MSNQALELIARIGETTKLGDLKKMAKEIKKDHELAMTFWETKEHFPRLLAVLIMDKQLLTEEVLIEFVEDLAIHKIEEKHQIFDWLLANQLTKSKKTKELLESWQHHELSDFRRLFWYHQARLRWTGQPSPDNTDDLMNALEDSFDKEAPEVQWTMNYCAAWIGVFDPKYKERCIKLGKEVGLYKDEKVAKGCTPSYLPEFIRIEYAKRNP